MTGVETDLPPGWALSSLGGIGLYHNGRGFKKEEWARSGRPIIRIQNLTSTGKSFNHFGGEVDPRNEVHPGDILVSWAATLDVFRWDGPEAVLNQHIFKVESFIDRDFHELVLRAALDTVRQQTHGSGMVHVTRSRFLSTPVLLPPLHEQKRIVAAARRTEAAITTAIDRLQEARRDVERFNSATIYSTIDGSNDWPRVPLGELADVRSGLTKGRRTADITRPHPFIRAANVQDGWLDLSEIKTIDATDAEIDKFSLQAGDVLLVEGSGTASRLGTGWVWEQGPSPCLHQNHVFRARPDQRRLCSHYLAWVLQAESTRAHFRGAAKTTSGLNTINRRQVCALPVPLPQPEEQKRIVKGLEAAAHARQQLAGALEAALTDAAAMKRAVLHMTVTGTLVAHDPSEGDAHDLLAQIRLTMATRNPGRKVNVA